MNAVKKKNAPVEYRDIIVDAAIKCFQERGVAKTSMDDVTKKAELGRMTVYRTFRTRADLLHAVALRRMTEVGESLKFFFTSDLSLEDALIEGSLKIVESSRKDEILFSVIEHAADRGVEHFLIDPNSSAGGVTLNLFSDVFRFARIRGEIRDDLSDFEITTWLRAVHLILFLRDDLDDDGRRSIIRNFVLPSLRNH